MPMAKLAPTNDFLLEVVEHWPSTEKSYARVENAWLIALIN